MFSFPESYGAAKKGLHIPMVDLREAGEVSGVLQAPMNWLDDLLVRQCRQHIPSPEDIDSNVAKRAHCFLKQQIMLQQH